MTEAEARRLAATDKDYRARKMRGRWVVWCDMADHVVDFEPLDPRREMNGPFSEYD